MRFIFVNSKQSTINNSQYYSPKLSGFFLFSMNQSYQRALNEISILKKALNSEQTSNQNSLQQIDTLCKIIQERNQIIRTQQQKNKALNRQLNAKNNKIQEISRQYEDHIINIKQIIDQKDIEIKKYSQIKITDYDMMRLRVLNQVQTQHEQQLQNQRRQIKKLQYLNNQLTYQIKVFREKNQSLAQQVQELKQRQKQIEEQSLSSHSKQLNRIYLLLEKQKIERRQAEKRIQTQKQKHSQLIKKYHDEFEAAQKQIHYLSNGKENRNRLANFNNGSTLGNGSSLIQFKENEFAAQNQKLKRNLKEKQAELDQIKSKHKQLSKQTKKQINQLEKRLSQSQIQIKKYKQQLAELTDSKQKDINKFKKDYEKKQEALKQKYQSTIQFKNKQLKLLKTQFNEFKETNRNDRGYNNIKQKDFGEDSNVNRIKQENQQLYAKIKKLNSQIQMLKNKQKQDKFQNRQTKSVSVQQVKDKLKAANVQIVTLLKDKIALNQRISQLNPAK